ncbi:MAG: crossover junction endodeoxyribonuclease RuvC [Candidatus Levybacteria bacterium]|nr:crossover junction endodeoxyribonuclease RuvC [Candidatus Levybacteria bacterium]
MKILGIDPGIGRTGWGTIQVQSSKFKVQSYGCIETSKELPLEKRIQEIYESLSRIIKEEKPDEVAVEELFFNTNAKTALIVGQARGVILLAAAQEKLPVAVYTPLQVKIALTGYGRAEKMQVAQMVMRQLHLEKKPKYDDISDALAIALTHAFSWKTKLNY